MFVIHVISLFCFHCNSYHILSSFAGMSLLALQFGIQPMLVRKYTPQTIVRSSVVLVQELVKFGIAGTIYFSGTKKETREKDLDGELYFHTLFMICNFSCKLLFGFSYLHFIHLLTYHFLSVTMLLHLYYRLVCQDMDFSCRTSCFSLHHPKPGCSYGLPESGSTHLQCTQPD